MKWDLTRYFFLFSVLIPISVGFWRFRQLQPPFKLFFVWLSLGFLSELLSINTNDTGLKIQFSYLYTTIAIFLYINFVMLLRGSKFSWIKVFLIFSAVAVFFLTDYLLQYDVLIKKRWGMVVSTMFCIFLSIPVVIDQFSNSTIKPYKNSVLLILISLIVSYLFFDILIILMAFLYDDNTKLFFFELFKLKLFLNLLIYIAYSFAFLWAAKKETYLLH
jgi:hypothetical protein